MPNNWVFGQTIGLGIDEKDQVWIIHRGNDPGNLDATEFAHPPPRRRAAGGRGAAAPAGVRLARARCRRRLLQPSPNQVSECCDPAPPVVAFDQAGNVVHSWGGPSLHPDWPESNHGIIVDHKGIVWIGGNGGPDSHILKFTREGKFVGDVRQEGRAHGRRQARRQQQRHGQLRPRGEDLHRPEGQRGVRRRRLLQQARRRDRHGLRQDQAVLGRLRQQARRRADRPLRPEGAARAAVPHAGALRRAVERRLVYVCDRPNDRIQVFTKEGKFVKEKQLFPETLSDGSVWDIAFSRDPQQRFLYMADGANEHVYIIDRNSLEVALAVRHRRPQPGQFRGVHSIAVDSKGNIYTTETYTGKRLQKFVFKGMGAPQKGVPWPTTK